MKVRTVKESGKMRVRTTVGVRVVGLVAAGPPAVLGAEVGTAFGYQGELLDSSVPVDGLTDFEFTLGDAVALRNQIGPTLSPAVKVTNGRFCGLADALHALTRFCITIDLCFSGVR